VRRTRADGYRHIEAYAPFSVEGLSEALEFKRDRVPVITLLGGIAGVVVALVGAQFPINGTQPVILDYSIPLALGVSAAIGVFFGVYPAARAAAMQPIQALRST
jgi:hypothetical protein